MDADSAPSATVLVNIDTYGDREQIESHLSASDSYTLVEGGSPRDVGRSIDLWVVDPSALERNHATISEVRSAQSPHYLPVLLLCPKDKLSSLESTVWEHVDDVVGLPVTPRALNARIENLLRIRTLSGRAMTSEQRFDSLVSTTSSAIFFLTPDMTIQFVNEAGERLFGYESEELLGRSISELIPPRLREVAGEKLAQYHDSIGQGTNGSTLESVGRHKNGSEIPIQLSYGWFELDGEMYLTGIITEIAALKQRETRLQVLNRVLRHDIRNDINLIIGYAELLKGAPSVSDEYLDTILSAAEDIVRLSDQAQELNQLFEADQKTKRTIDVREMIEKKTLAVRGKYPAATITAEFRDDESLRVRALSLLDSVIDNLLENAVEHNDTDAPEIAVTVGRRDGEWISIEIADNGPGLPSEEVEVIETGTETPLEHASGLGLWLVNWIILESEGRIEFSRNDPRGSRIRLLLPAA